MAKILLIDKEFAPMKAIRNLVKKIDEVIYKVNENTEAIDSLPVQPKIYKALLTQSGEDAPEPTELVNTLGETVTWTRAAAGDYSGTFSTGGFSQDKVFVLIQQNNFNNNGQTYALYNGADKVNVNTSDFTNTYIDGTLYYSSILIEVYP